MIIPIALAILALLFAMQSKGTEHVARFFGPITAVWFIVMGLGGLVHISDVRSRALWW